MKEVSILIVEDDSLQSQSLCDLLSISFSNLKLEVIETESDFINNFSKIVSNPADLIIMDIMLKWSNPKINMTDLPEDIEKEGFYTAGFRCLKLLKSNPKTKILPLIIRSTIDKEELVKRISFVPSNWVIISKVTPDNKFLLSLRSMLPNQLEQSKETQKSNLLDTVTLKPSFMGFSIDLKKIFNFFKSRKKK